LVFDSVTYQASEKRILKGVHLKINAGEICGIFGRNGSGKSTLIKIGAGLFLPTSGTVFIDQKAFLKHQRYSRFEKIAYLAQDTFLPKDLKIKTLLKSFSKLAYELLNKTILKSLIDQKIHSLSGGERKLLEIILIFSLDRKYLLLDEPFTGIEPIIIEKMIELIKEQRNKGKGILITDHYYRYLLANSDRAYLMEQGYCKPIESNENLMIELKNKGYLV
jgi:ABC-type multidrug transport system ATPase subunit